MTRLLLEGGPSLLASCVPVLDELCLTISPILVGAPTPARPAPDLLAGRVTGERNLRLAHLLEAEGVLISRWLVEPDEAPARR
jgi:riboflavin biosynthesis pyrimidine reductase